MLKVILITLFLALLSSLPVAAAADGGMSSRVAALKASAEQGDRSALWDLGAIYTSGEGDVKRDYREGLKWWRMLADVGGIGSGDALVEIGRLYYDGHGVEQDYAEAARWYRKAAEQGFFQGEFLLGLVYRDGKGVPQSDTEAAKWVRMAAEQNFDSAQTILGSMYENGKGVKKNYAEAAWWYRRASEMNDRRAFYGLGRIYAQGGFGVGQDWSESYFWWSLAKHPVEPDARSGMQAAAQHLTSQQIELATERAEEWRPLSRRAISRIAVPFHE